MTAAEWLTCTNPTPMLNVLRGKASERKLRLFAVACCRRDLDEHADEQRTAAVASAERLADGQGTMAMLAAVRAALAERCGESTTAPEQIITQTEEPLANIVADVIWAVQERAVSRRLARLDQSLSRPVQRRACAAWRKQEEAAQAKLLRDVFGPLPGGLAALAATWRTANVTALAQTIYAERAFDRMPILADAIEDAGCTDADILDHCRQPGEHARGCWVVDLVLGKS